MNNEHWLRWSPRPLAMLISALTFLYSGIGVSVINTVLMINGVAVTVPPIDSVTQNNLLLILLGVGAMRSIDKKNGV